MSVKTNVPPSCSLQTQTTARQVPAQPKPRGLLTHNHSSNPIASAAVMGLSPHGRGKERSRMLGWDPHIQPHSSPRQTPGSCWPTPQGCLLGNEDAHGQAGLPCVSSQGRGVPRLTHITPECAQPPGSRSCSGDHFTQRFHLTDQRH